MILRHSVVIQSATRAVSDEGIPVPTWTTLKTIAADVQPARLSETDAQALGIVDRSANAKKMFFYLDPAINEGQRAVFDSKTYDILGINDWQIHTVAILVPVVKP